MEKKQQTIKIGAEEQKIPEATELLDIKNIFGVFKTVDTTSSGILTGVPRRFADQIVFYKNGATLRLYMFNVTAGTWHYTSLT